VLINNGFNVLLVVYKATALIKTKMKYFDNDRAYILMIEKNNHTDNSTKIDNKKAQPITHRILQLVRLFYFAYRKNKV